MILHREKNRSAGGDNTFVVALVTTSLILALAAGFVYWRYNWQGSKPETRQNISKSVEFDQVYADLGISGLPPQIEKLPRIRTRLEQLSREACYRDAAGNLAESLIEAGYPREAATGVRNFVKRCSNSEGLLRIAYSALDSIGDFHGALDVADQLVKAYPSNGSLRYSRARSYDHLGDFPHALIDYINAVQLASDPKLLIGDVFYHLSRMYAETGRYCDAITPIETYISLDPLKRRTPQTAKIISEYAEKGNCGTAYASGAARVSLSGHANVPLLRLSLNDVEGNFILDTGATFVSVTSQFASRARISTETGNQIILKTVGGTALAEIGYADLVRLDKAEARGVVVAVDRSSGSPFGDRIDGLLGMSFLARFNLNLSPSRIELSAIPLSATPRAERK